MPRPPEKPRDRAAPRCRELQSRSSWGRGAPIPGGPIPGGDGRVDGCAGRAEGGEGRVDGWEGRLVGVEGRDDGGRSRSRAGDQWPFSRCCHPPLSSRR